jgi:hypothetical protein
LFQLFQIHTDTQGIVPIGALAIGQLSPAIKCSMEGILFLSLKGLQAQVSLQFDLTLLKMRLAQHPAKGRQQTIGITVSAFETDQNSVFMGVTTQTGAATFNEIRQLQMIDRAASPAEHRTQKLMTAPLPKRISTASPPDPELCGEHPGRGHRVKNEIAAWAQALSSGRAIRVKLR